jgi:hypothetical protein
MNPDASTAIHDALKTGHEYLKNASRLEQIGLNRLEHVPNCRERMPMFLYLSKLIQNHNDAVGCNHGYTRITPIVQVVAIRGKNRDSVT